MEGMIIEEDIIEIAKDLTSSFEIIKFYIHN